MSKMPDKPKKYEERLMDTLNFDEDDLAANEAGQLSTKQIFHLKQKRRISASEGAGFSFLLLLALIFGVLVSVGSAGSDIPGTLAPIFFCGLAIVGLLLYFARRAQRLSQDIQENSVQSTEGRVDLTMSGGQNPTYFMRINTLRFPLRQRAFLAFKNGDPYRVYYIARSKRIMSVEWLRENDDNLIDDREADAGESANDELVDGEATSSQMKQG